MDSKVAYVKEEMKLGVPAARVGAKTVSPIAQVEQALARQRVAPLLKGPARMRTFNEFGTAFDLRQRLDCAIFAQMERPPMFPSSHAALQTMLDTDEDISVFDYLGEERCDVCPLSPHDYLEIKYGI